MADASFTQGNGLKAAPFEARPSDYFELLKPRVMRLSIFTALVGMVAAPVWVHPVIALAAVLCIAAGAGACGALNMWWDADLDRQMARTRSRPIPSGRVSGGEALGIGLFLAVLSVVMLGLFTNAVAAGLLAFTIFFYVVIYSMYLKRRTAQNIVIGGAAGALPPVIGWAVATGDVSLTPLLLFALIFVWTPPHFWALALFRNDDYTRAGVPMLPVTQGTRSARRHILGYSLLLVPVALAPAFTVAGGPAYLATAVVLSALLLFGAVRLARRTDAIAAADRFRVERRFFAFTILLLFLLFVALLADALLQTLGLAPASWPVWF
jgi:protoheme IX farnesyltransferase